MQKNMTDRTPGSYDDFVAYLGTVRTEEELFSRLTYWFAGQNRPEDVLSRSELVEARAKELGFWQGLTFRMERWLTDGKSELEAVGREEFQSRIAEDYAAYREKADAARARFRDRRRAAPFNFTPDCLQNVPIQNVSWLVDGLLPMGEVSLLGADGGTGKGIWQAQLIAYVTAGRTSGFFPQPPEKTGSVLLFSGEDDPGKVLKARLTAAGADMSRVMVVTSDAYFARTGSPLCIPDTGFAKYVGKAAPALVIIDPLQSFLPAGVEMASRNQMRSILLPLLNLEDDMYTDLAASISAMMVRSYAVAIVKPAEGKTDAVKSALEAYVTSEQQSMEHYLEDQYQIAKAATVTVAPTGEVILVCAENHDTLLDNIEKALAA